MALVVARLLAELSADDASLRRALSDSDRDLRRVSTRADAAGTASKKMSADQVAAYNRMHASATRLSIAEQKLADAKRTGTATTQQLMRMEASVRSARASAISTASRYQSVQNQVTRSNRDAEKSANTLTGALGKVNGALGALGIAAGATMSVKFFTDAIQNARALGAQINQLDIFFGDSADVITKWSETAVEKMSMSQRAARGAALDFSTFGSAAGLAGQQLAGFTMRMTELAADAASFYAVTPQEMIDDMSSAFAGQARPMQKYGVLLQENTLKQTAYNHGITETVRKLSQTERIQTVYVAMMEQMSMVNGDIERTSEAFGQKLKRLQGRFEEASAAIGQKLMPMAKGFIDILSGPGISALSGFGNVIGAAAGVIFNLAQAFGDLPGPIQAALAAVVGMRLASRLFGTQIDNVRQRVNIAGGSLQGFRQDMLNAQRAARLTGGSMSTAQSAIYTVGRRAAEASSLVARMQASFVRAAAEADRGMPRTAGTISAAWTGMKGAASGLIGVLGGPWGLAITGATVALGYWMQKKAADKRASQEAAAGTQEYADALAKTNGVIDDNIRSMTITKMANKGMIEDAQTLKISEGDVALAILERGQALDALNAKLVEQERVYKNLGAGYETEEKAARKLREGINALSGELTVGETRAKSMRKASDDVAVSFEGSTKPTGAMADALTEFAESTDDAQTRVDKLTRSLNQLAGNDLTEEEALQDWHDNLRGLVKAFGEAGEAAVTLNGRIDVTTEKGSALQNAVVSQADSFRSMATATFATAQNMGKTMPEALEATRAKLVEQRQAFIDSMTASGMSADAAQRVADAYGMIPDRVVTSLTVPGIDDALAGTALLITQLNNMPSSTAVSVTAPAGQAVLSLMERIGAQTKVDNNKNIVVTNKLGPEQLSLLKDLGLAVRTDNNKTIIVTDNGTAKNTQDAIDSIRGKTVAVEIGYTFKDDWGNVVGSGLSATGIPLRDPSKLTKTPDGKASGGRLPTSGPGTDTRDGIYGVDGQGRGIAMLDGGEWVINRDSSRKYDRELAQINAGTMPHLAGGGVASKSDATSASASAGAAPLSGSQAGSAALGLGLGANLSSVADEVTKAKASKLDPAMEGLTQGVASYGLTTQRQGEAIGASWRATGTAIQGAASQTIKPALTTIQGEVGATGDAVADVTSGQIIPAISGTGSHVVATASEQINPALESVGATVADVHASSVDPTLGAMRGAVDNTAASFGTGASAIATQWNAVREATAAPVRFAIGTVFNDGLVGMWNSVSELVGAKGMKPYSLKFDTGGVMPGFTPGQDVHHFTSPTGGNLALSGGEAIMRPEWTRAVGGPREVERMNALARTGRYRRPGTDQYLGGDMAFASGGVIANGAQITSAIQRAMWDAVRTAFPNAILTSGTRYADVGSGFDNHMGQRALDLTGPMPEMARWIYQMNRKQPVEELIHWPLNGWQNLKGGSPLDYGAGTNADHMDHVHWAMSSITNNAGKLVSMGTGSGPVKSVGQMIEETLAPLRKKIETQIAAQKFGGQVGEIPGGVFTELNTKMTAKLKDLASKFAGPSVSGGAGVERWRPMVRAALRRNGFEVNKRNEDLMLAQINTESGGDPGITQGVIDVNSGGNEAVGLLQIVPGTFDAFRDPSLPNDRRDPWANMNAALRYYRSRYGEDLGAMWGKGHGYNGGGTIPGAGNKDTVPAMLTPGEEVIKKDAAEKNRPMLKAINAGNDVRVYVTNWPTSTTPTAVEQYVTDDTNTGLGEDLNYDTNIDDTDTEDDTNNQRTTTTRTKSTAEDIDDLEKELADASTFKFDITAPWRPKWLVDGQNEYRDRIRKEIEREMKLEEAKQDQIDSTAAVEADLDKAREKLKDAQAELAKVTKEGDRAKMVTAQKAVEDAEDEVAELNTELRKVKAGEATRANTRVTSDGKGTKEKPAAKSQLMAAENRVIDAQRKVDEANDRLALAQMRLGEVKPDAKPSTRTAAEQAVERARNSVAKAEASLRVAQQKKQELEERGVKLWTGGTVPGTGSGDIVPAMLTPGEEVIKKHQAQKHRALLKAINAGQLDGYADGGTVGWGGYSTDTRDYMAPNSLSDLMALGIGGMSSLASMVAPYAQMAISGQIDLGNLTPTLDTSADDPTGGFGTAIVGDYASQISSQLSEMIRLLAAGKDIHIEVKTDDGLSAANMVSMASGV